MILLEPYQTASMLNPARGTIVEGTHGYWCYWRFSICLDWGSLPYLAQTYPDARIYDKDNNKVDRINLL